MHPMTITQLNMLGLDASDHFSCHMKIREASKVFYEHHKGIKSLRDRFQECMKK